MALEVLVASFEVCGVEANDTGKARFRKTNAYTSPIRSYKEVVVCALGIAVCSRGSRQKDTRIGGPLEGANVHIVHLSDSSISLDLIKEAKSHGDGISVETCPHMPNGDTHFKCSLPIRDASNNEKLWEAVLGGHIDILTSDHSPTVPELKLLKEGDFLKAFFGGGGVTSLQFDLPMTWTYGKKCGLTLEQLSLLWSKKPTKFVGLESKGTIAVGNHADIVVWQPERDLDLNDHYPVFLKHPSLSAYMGRRLSGKVLDTFVRGNLVFKKGKHAPAACGVPILAK